MTELVYHFRSERSSHRQHPRSPRVTPAPSTRPATPRASGLTTPRRGLLLPHGRLLGERALSNNLIAWAKQRGLFVRVDRATPWGNPFVLGRDGDRATVIARYRDDHLPSRPDLLARLGELRGKALGCWCAPGACHADALTGELSGAPRPAEHHR